MSGVTYLQLEGGLVTVRSKDVDRNTHGHSASNDRSNDQQSCIPNGFLFLSNDAIFHLLVLLRFFFFLWRSRQRWMGLATRRLFVDVDVFFVILYCLVHGCFAVLLGSDKYVEVTVVRCETIFMRWSIQDCEQCEWCHFRLFKADLSFDNLKSSFLVLRIPKTDFD
jgi:hypothetical protein